MTGDTPADDHAADDHAADDRTADATAADLLSGAYALDSVSPEEKAAVENAVDQSPALREHIGQLVETASLLGLATEPVQPSPQLKSALMAKIASTPQLSAEDGPADGPVAQQFPARRLPAQQVPAQHDPQGSSTINGAPSAVMPETETLGSAETRARSRWGTKSIRFLAAAAAAVVLFVGGGLLGSALSGRDGTSSLDEVSASALASILAAPDNQHASAPIEGGGTATLVWSNDLGRSVVFADGLPPLPAGKVYEAWYIHDSGPVSAGTFTPSGEGKTWHALDGSMSAGDAVGITVEPAGGSEQPTTDPILVMDSA